jgi:hypothetical protein
LEAESSTIPSEGDDQKVEKKEGFTQKLKMAKKIVTKVVFPVLFGMAEVIPVIGRISRLLSKCGSALQELSNQDSLVKNLRTGISNVRAALQTYEEVFQLKDEEEIMKNLPLKSLEDSLEKALETLLSLTEQKTLLGVIFAQSDNQKLRDCTSNLNQSLLLFYTSIPLYQKLLQDQQQMNELLHYPVVFHSTIRDHLSRFQAGSRQWLFEEISVWFQSALSVEGGDGAEMKGSIELNQHQEREKNRVFWIRAEPGMGKSAFAATLSQKLKHENVFLGAYFCRYTEANESFSQIIRSLSAQCLENLSATSPGEETKKIFEDAFKKWDVYRKLEKPSSSDLFELLLIKPLQKYSEMISRSRAPHPMVFLIDALDEMSLDERKLLLPILSSKIESLPSWVKFVITSRPETDIVSSLERLQPFEIKEDDPRHLEDIQLYATCKLREVMDANELKDGVDLFVSRSEGRFIYVSIMIEDLLQNKLSRFTLSDLDNRLPEGMVGWYREFFVRVKSRDQEYFIEVIFPVVKLIIGSKEPLSLAEVKLFLNLQLSNVQETRLVENLHQLFSLRNGNRSTSPDSKVFVPFHKSVFDWLADEESSGSYSRGLVRDHFYISKADGNEAFTDYFQSLFAPTWLDEGNLSFRPASGGYFYRHAFDHFLDSSIDDVVLFGLNQLFRLRVLASLLEEIGAFELMQILERYLTSFSSRFQHKSHDISELKLLPLSPLPNK